MSRVISHRRLHFRRVALSLLSAGLAVSVLGLPAATQEPPLCTTDRPMDCRLADWSDSPQRDLPSLFGAIEPIVWVDDENGDAPASGLDILGVGIGRVDIGDPTPIREAEELLRQGKAKQAVRPGPGLLVRIVLDRAPQETGGDHASVHVATDIDGSRSDNAPGGVASPDDAFAGSQDIYSLTWASTTGKTRLLDSDLVKGWYKGKDPFAASWAAANVLDMLITPAAFGDGFRVVTHVAGPEGGFDSVGLGPAAIPSDGRVDLVPTCLEGSISTEPFVVGRLVESGQTLRDVEAPASWRGGVRLPLEEASRDALEAVIEASDEDDDGRIALASSVNLFEDGIVIRQRPAIELALDGDDALLVVELGLTRRGYNVLRDFEVAPTGDPSVDAWLERATGALSEHMPPFRSTKKAGLIVGERIGACIPWLGSPTEPGSGADQDGPVDVAPDAAASA